MSLEIKIGITFLLIVIALLPLAVFAKKKGKNNIMQNTNSQNETAEKPAKAIYRRTTPKEAKEMMDTDADIILVDVRTPEEYNQGRIAKSILIPDYDIATLASSKLPDKESKIIVYCRSGGRSQGAAKRLVSLGYVNVYDLGGIMSWPYGTTK